MPFSMKQIPKVSAKKISLKSDFKPFCDGHAEAIIHLVHTGYHARRNNETGNSETMSASFLKTTDC